MTETPPAGCTHDPETALTPHKYPLWITTIALCSLACVTYFCIVHLPKYKELKALLQNADTAFTKKRYSDANNIYKKIFHQVKENKEIVLKIVKVCLALGDKKSARKLLKHFTLTNEESQDLSKFISEECPFY